MAQLRTGGIITYKKKRRALALTVGLLLFAVYLLVYRGGFHSIDEVSIFAVTESLVKFGRFNTDQIAWTQWTTSQAEAQGFFGQTGHVYSKKGLALSLAQAPLYWLALNLPSLGMLQTVSVLNALVTAATGLAIFMFVWRLNYSPATAVIVALIYGLATIAFVYAKYLFSEPLAAFFLLLAAYMLFTYHQEGGLRHIAISGLAAGFAVLTRANNLFLLPVFGLYLLWVVWEPTRQLSADQQMGEDPEQLSTNKPSKKSTSHASRSTLRARRLFSVAVYPLIVFILTLAIPGIVLMGYNAIRSGNPLQTGYDLTLFSPDLLLGLYKLLFSPLRGLFIYSPILLLSLPGWWLLRKPHPPEAWLFAGLVGVTIGLFAAWSSGEGLSWGSRFLVPVMPFLVIVLAPLIEKVSGKSEIQDAQPVSRFALVALRFSLYALLFLSVLIQLLAVTINPWVYLAQIQAEFGGEFFLENTAALYDFRYSQIFGQLQSWSVHNSDLAWWQPWGFDKLAFSLSLALVLLFTWLLWRQLTGSQQSNEPIARHKHASRFSPYSSVPQGAFTPRSLPGGNLIYAAEIIVIIAITYFLLARYFITDQQFGTPDDSFTRALNAVMAEASPNDQLITVAQTHYHVPMNRFKARMPIIGFAQQTWPPPDTALPLLEASLSGQNTWLITHGFPPAAKNNATEQWLAFNAFKANDEWLDETRVVHYGTDSPIITRPIKVTFGQEIELVKIKTIETVQPGQLLPVELVWQPVSQPTTDYSLFLQLLDANNVLVAQHDNPPNSGYSPTSTWRPGQQILGRHALALPSNLPSGDYRLITGLYDPTTGRRLTVNDNRDFAELGDVAIMPAAEAGD